MNLTACSWKGETDPVLGLYLFTVTTCWRTTKITMPPHCLRKDIIFRWKWQVCWPPQNNPALAEQFMQFMLTPDFQKTLPTTNWMYPVIDMPVAAGLRQNAETGEDAGNSMQRSGERAQSVDTDMAKRQSAVNCRIPDTGRTRVRSSSGRCCRCPSGRCGFNTPDTDWQADMG